MGDIGLPELIVILAIALLVFGPSHVPDVGRALREFREAIRGEAALGDGHSRRAAPGAEAPSDVAGTGARR